MSICSHFQVARSLPSLAFLRTNKLNKRISAKHIDLLSRVATCFDPIGPSSGLHYEPVY